MADPTITCTSGTSCTLVVTAVPYIATQDDYDAINTIFGLTLVAACVIWGVKQLYHLVRSRPEA